MSKGDMDEIKKEKRTPLKSGSMLGRGDSQLNMDKTNDDLQLRILPKTADTKSAGFGVSEELVDHLNEQICGLKNECARLYNLMREKDVELKRMKKMNEEVESAGVAGVTNEVVAVKIVELSKRVRDLTAEVESEKAKSKQALSKVREMEQANKLSAAKSTNQAAPPSTASTQLDEDKMENELKTASDRVRVAEAKILDLRNQLEESRREARVAIRVLTQEVGDGVDVHTLLRSEGQPGWKGRAQQIQMLKKQLTDLKASLGSNGSVAGEATQRNITTSDASDFDSVVMSAGDLSTARQMGANSRHVDALRRFEKERRLEQDRLMAEKQALERDLEDTKQRFNASKARIKTLQEDVKSMKERIEQLLEKSRHDDEFVQVLLKQQETLRQSFAAAPARGMSASSSSDKANKVKGERTVIISNESQRNSGSANRVAELERTITRLQQEIEQTRSTARGLSFDSQSLQQNEAELTELRSLLQAANMECNRLTDLVRNLHDQMHKVMEERLSLTSDLLNTRKEQVLLEKQIGKLKLELDKATGRGGEMASQRHRSEVSLSELEDLRAKVEVLTEERASYRAALEKSAQQRKSELSLFENLLDETKRLFSQSVRQLARKTVNGNGSGVPVDPSAVGPELVQSH